MKSFLLRAILGFALLLACSRDHPTASDAGLEKPAEEPLSGSQGERVSEPGAGGAGKCRGGSDLQSQAGTDLQPWFDFGSRIWEIHPRPDPTLRFYAWTIMRDGSPFGPIVAIYWVRVHSTAEYRPVGDPKWHFLEEHSAKNLNSGCVILQWDTSMPFAWEGKMESEHGYKFSKFAEEYVFESEAGPVLAHEPMGIRP